MGRAPAGQSARRQPEGAREYRACWGPPPSPEERHRPGRGPRRQTACCLGLSALLQGSHPQIADRSEGFPEHPLPRNSWTGRLCGSGLEAWAPGHHGAWSPGNEASRPQGASKHFCAGHKHLLSLGRLRLGKLGPCPGRVLVQPPQGLAPSPALPRHTPCTWASRCP